MIRPLQRLRRFGDDERAVSPVVGFVLIFALIMIVYSMYQASVVPSQNEQVEYEHSRTIEGQMEELTAAVISAGPDAAPRGVKLQLGVNYPTRAFAINPGDPAGSIGTSDPHEIRIEGRGGTATLETSFVDYRPNYNLKTEETELSIQNGMLVKQFSSSDNTLLASAGGLFPANESRVDLSVVSGDLRRNELSTVVTPTNAATHTIEVTSDNAVLHLPTTLSADQWRSTIDGKAQVKRMTYSTSGSGVNYANLVLQSDVAIRTDEAGVGEADSNDSNDLGLEPRLTNVTARSIDATNGTTNVTVRTTDIFGSGLADTAIEVSTNGGGSVMPTETQSGSDGTVDITYDSADSDMGRTVDVTATLADRSGENSSVTFELNYPAGEENATNATSREPIKANQLQTGAVNQLDFKITPPSLSISGFSVVAKREAAGINETSYANQFQLTNSKYIPGESGYGPLRYSSGEPIQFDGQDYIFQNGPRRVVSSRVYLQQWPNGKVDVHGFAGSYKAADMIVYFILDDGSRRPVYIDATVAGSATTNSTATA